MPDLSDLLSNPRSERVKAIRALGRRHARQKSGTFVVEGAQGVQELLEHRPDALVDLYVTAAGARRYAQVPRAAAAAGRDVRECTDAVMTAMADTDHPQGVLAVARTVDVPLQEALGQAAGGFVVVLHEIRDPGNAGTVLRAADAFGAAAVLVSDASVDVHNPKLVRSTVGSLFHLPVTVGHPIEHLMQACRDAGLRLLAADGSGSRELPDLGLQTPHAWILGNEAHGLPAQVRQACDEVVRVPITRAESLNLAMAATVCLYASSRGLPGISSV